MITQCVFSISYPAETRLPLGILAARVKGCFVLAGNVESLVGLDIVAKPRHGESSYEVSKSIR